jgi:multimeric flavodoxin WrbA
MVIKKEKEALIMEIVCVLGSPRSKGNSNTIVNKFCETARNKGANVKFYELNQLNYKGCQGCMSCKTKSDRCVVDDDLAPVLNSIFDADVLVMSSPVYMGEVNGQLKSFIDRTFSFLDRDYLTNPKPSRLPEGKKALFVMTQGAPEEMFGNIHPRIEMMLQRYGFVETHTIRGCGMRDVGEAEKNEAVMNLAVQTAEKMLG